MWRRCVGSGYVVDHRTLYGPDFGLPQQRRRLVLVASRLGHIALPQGNVDRGDDATTVRRTIADLPKAAERRDRLWRPAPRGSQSSRRPTSHACGRHAPAARGETGPRIYSLRATARRAAGAFGAFYGRMVWDEPSPTITTQAFNFGTGRFGHPEQDRSLTLREAAMLQGFPRTYKFVPPGEKVSMQAVGRLIGNAVPPAFGRVCR
ncbi:DNA cytosine methyltransferase [Nocardioides convexus]|uniref:DNA cytosine methyltransferase n=1 Tax=Nocardioides convexus TaxID=2712224 RepID=UPI002418B41C|nr:DNA cytosine methyltransferase [Nocardioides convexus]